MLESPGKLFVEERLFLFERLSFDNTSGLKIIKYRGSKNVFFD